MKTSRVALEQDLEIVELLGRQRLQRRLRAEQVALLVGAGPPPMFTQVEPRADAMPSASRRGCVS